MLLLCCSLAVLFSVHTVSANTTAKQRILPEGCIFTVVDPETQSLHFVNPEVCDPQPPSPPPRPVQPDATVDKNDDEMPIGGTAQDEPPIKPNLPQQTSLTLGGVVDTILSLFLSFAWAISWVVAIVLTVVLLILIAFGGAGLSKLLNNVTMLFGRHAKSSR